MDQRTNETIGMADLQIAIVRQPTTETYLALEPPEALPYVVVPFEAAVPDIASFIQQHIDELHELRQDMLKHFKKVRSLRCRFRTGDVVFLLGRPFMLKSNPLSSTHSLKYSARGRANVMAMMNRDLSVIDLFVMQVGNYDQGKAAFLSCARPLFAHNVKSLLMQCMQRVFPDAAALGNVICRPMRDSWVRFDEEHDAIWFSESLIPYPPNAVVYAYLIEAIKYFAPNASEDERRTLMERGVPDHSEMRDLLNDRNNRFAF